MWSAYLFPFFLVVIVQDFILSSQIDSETLDFCLSTVKLFSSLYIGGNRRWGYGRGRENQYRGSGGSSHKRWGGSGRSGRFIFVFIIRF